MEIAIVQNKNNVDIYRTEHNAINIYFADLAVHNMIEPAWQSYS
jgi:hypothetical protein